MSLNHNGIAMLLPLYDQNQIAIIPNDNYEFMIVQIMLIQIITFFNNKITNL